MSITTKYNLINDHGNHRSCLSGYMNPEVQDELVDFMWHRLKKDGRNPRDIAIVGSDNSSTAFASAFIRRCWQENPEDMPVFWSLKRGDRDGYGQDKVETTELHGEPKFVLFLDDDVVTGSSMMTAVRAANRMNIPVIVGSIHVFLEGWDISPQLVDFARRMEIEVHFAGTCNGEHYFENDNIHAMKFLTDEDIVDAYDTEND